MTAIVGRDHELEEVASFLEWRPGGARVLLIEGEPGIGKTTVWRAAGAHALESGARVVSCSAAGSEANLAFTGVRDLLAGPFGEVATELPAPQRHALDVALLLEEPSSHPPTQATVAVAFLTTLRLLAHRGPTVVAVDDAQWLDADSTAVLRYALRRLDDERLGFVLARRHTEVADPLELDRLPTGLVRTLDIGPVTVGALGRILHAATGLAYARPTLQRVHEISGGNAFFALELARTLGEGANPLRLGAPIPVPRAVRELLDERLTSLPRPTLDALSFAAALSRPTIELVGAAVGADPVPLLAPAADAGNARVEDGVVRFGHPLFATAVDDVAADRQRAVHARLADVVPDVEERARHLALGSDATDEPTAAAIEEGARTAFARGSSAAAAELAAHARRLTPPAAAPALRRRTVSEADYAFASGDTTRASSLLRDLVETTPPGPERAHVFSKQARLQHFEREIAGSVALLYRALEQAGDDSALRGEIEEGLAWGLLLVRSDLAGAAEHARSAARIAEARGDLAALAEGLAAQAVVDFVAGGDWLPAMTRALSLEDATRELRVLRQPSFAHGYCLSCADELDNARDVFAELLRRAEQDGDESSVPSVLNHLTLIECLAGRYEEAAALADEGFSRALDSGQLPTQTSIRGKQALLAARTGDLDAARASAAEALAGTGATPTEAIAHGGETAIWALGAVELAAGRPDEADRLLHPMCQAVLTAGVEEPGELRSLPDAIEALLLLGRLPEADAFVRRLEGWARRLDRPSTLAAARRCRGLFEAAAGNTEAALGALEDAARIFERTPLPFERAQALFDLGSLQRRLRQRRAARDTLQGALALFDQIGARLSAEKTRAELGRIGGRSASPGELTPTEQRIAELVAGGMTNREVASALVITVHTVEAALTSIYRKLDVRSRTEMARKLPGLA